MSVPSSDTHVPIKQLIADYDLTLGEVLAAAGLDEGDGDTLVSQEVVLTTLDIESIENEEINRQAGPKRLTRADRAKLDELTEWARSKRPLSIPADAKPEKVDMLGRSGKVRYMLMGQEFYMDATEFVMAQRGIGSLEGAGTNAQPHVSRQEINQKAHELRAIMAGVYPNCELCGVEIEDYGPEVSMIFEMLRGGVLAEGTLKVMRDAGEFRIHYRKMHLICRLWDRQYQEVAVLSVTNPEADLEVLLSERAEFVLAKAQEKRPEISLMDVLLTLKKIDLYLTEKYSTTKES